MKRILLVGILLILPSLMMTGCEDVTLVANEMKDFLLPTDIPHNEEEIPVWQDDFVQPESGWDRFENEQGSVRYGEGVYEIEVLQAQQFLWANAGIESPQDVRIKVRTQKVAGGADDFYGVICRYQDAGNFYAFLISSDGYAGIFERVNGSDLTSVTGEPMLPSEAIATDGSTNYMEVDCVGSHLALWVNGLEVQVVHDETFSPTSARAGDVGLLAGTFEANQNTVRFADFGVFGLK